MWPTGGITIGAGLLSCRPDGILCVRAAYGSVGINECIFSSTEGRRLASQLV